MKIKINIVDDNSEMIDSITQFLGPREKLKYLFEAGRKHAYRFRQY